MLNCVYYTNKNGSALKFTFSTVTLILHIHTALSLKIISIYFLQLPHKDTLKKKILKNHVETGFEKEDYQNIRKNNDVLYQYTMKRSPE